MDLDTYSDEKLEEHLRRTLSKSAALRRRRAARLQLAGLTIVIAVGGSLSAAMLSSGPTPANPFSAPTVVSGHMVYSGSNPRRPVAQGRVSFTNTSGREGATNVTDGTFRLYLPAGRYRVSGLARRPYSARCGGPSVTIRKKQRSATENVQCRRNG